MSENKAKRKRCSPFSKEDEMRLLEAVYGEKNIIENKETNKFSIGEKEKAWGRVAVSYNATASEFRNTDQLRSKFDNLKTKTRKIMAQELTHLRGTGGGGALLTNNDPIIDFVLKIVNETTVVGLRNNFDSDGIVDDEAREPFKIDIEDFCDKTFLLDANDGNVVAEQMRPESDDNRTAALSKETMNPTWSDYTLRRLKEPVSRKHRPATVSTLAIAKENCYARKAELMTEETLLRRAQNKREEEEHVLKKRLLELEIEIKTQELKKIVKL